MTYNNKARKTYHAKYGGKAGYSAEMRRRAALRKTYGYYNYFGWLKENDPEKLKQIIQEREEKRHAQSQDRQSRQAIQPLDKE